MEFIRGIRKRGRKKPGKGGKKSRFYAFDYKLRAVKLHLEDGVPVALICQKTGVYKGTLWEWIRAVPAEGRERAQERSQVPGG